MEAGLEQQTDEELMELVKQADDRRAYEILVLRYRESAVRYCSGLIHDEWQAQDLVQDGFADLYVQRKKYRKSSSFRALLYAVIRYKSVDYLRKNGRIEPTQTELLDMTGTPIASAEDLFFQREEYRTLLQWIEALPQKQRTALYLYCAEGLSYREIAARMGISVAQVKIQIYRARKELQRQRREYQ